MRLNTTLIGTVLAWAVAIQHAQAQVAPMSPAEPESLTSWQVATPGVGVDVSDNTLRLHRGPGWVQHHAWRTDFLLELEFRVAADSSGAVILRGRATPGQLPAGGYRVAVRSEPSSDEAAGQIRGLSQGLVTLPESGSAAQLVPAMWHRLTIRCASDIVQVWINGRSVSTVSGREWQAGVVGLEVTQGTVAFRNVRLQPLIGSIPPGIERSADKSSADFRIPEVLRSVQPRYTARAMHDFAEGSVTLEGVVTLDGTLEHVRVTESVHPDLDAEAIAAARRWTFRPATKNGEPVPAIVQMHLRFRVR